MLAVFGVGPIAPRHEARLAGCRILVAGGAREPRRFEVHLAGQGFHPVVGLGDACRAEGVRFDDVRAGREVLLVDFLDHMRLREREQFVVALDVAVEIREARAPIGRFVELVLLDHRAHRAVENQDALFEQRGHPRAARIALRIARRGGGTGLAHDRRGRRLRGEQRTANTAAARTVTRHCRASQVRCRCRAPAGQR